jgi:hypothetical protein
LEALVSPTKSYVFAFAVAWQAEDGTSPPAASPITATIEDSSIKAGDSIYEVTSSGLVLVGNAAQDGMATVTFTSDPIFVIVQQDLLQQIPLKITSGPGEVGSLLNLTTFGGSGSGSVSYSVVDGTATGCQVAGHTLMAQSAGTCIVTATKASDSKYSAVASEGTSITMVAKAKLGFVLLHFATGRSSLSAMAESNLRKFARKLSDGASVTCIGFAFNNSILALQRAAAVANYLSARVSIRVSLQSVKSGLDGWVIVNY